MFLDRIERSRDVWDWYWIEYYMYKIVNYFLKLNDKCAVISKSYFLLYLNAKNFTILKLQMFWQAVDTTERDRALQELEKEREVRRKVEMEAAQCRLQYQLAIEECNRLKTELDKVKRQLQTNR